jgi:hypothetical protein
MTSSTPPAVHSVVVTVTGGDEIYVDATTVTAAINLVAGNLFGRGRYVHVDTTLEDKRNGSVPSGLLVQTRETMQAAETFYDMHFAKGHRLHSRYSGSETTLVCSCGEDIPNPQTPRRLSPMEISSSRFD